MDKASDRDVAVALGYVNPRKAVKTHCKYLKPFKGTDMDPFDLHPDTHIIQESDMFRLVFHYHTPAAEKFQDWVMDDVLPSVRNHGFYGTDDKTYPCPGFKLAYHSAENFAVDDIYLRFFKNRMWSINLWKS